MINEKFIASGTLCWDCANATGGCDWADRLEPVEGWDAIQTKKNSALESYLVLNCPLFERDAYACGARRCKEGKENAQRR